MTIDTKKFYPNKYSMCLYQSYGILKDSGQYSTLAPVSSSITLLLSDNLLTAMFIMAHNLLVLPLNSTQRV